MELSDAGGDHVSLEFDGADTGVAEGPSSSVLAGLGGSGGDPGHSAVLELEGLGIDSGADVTAVTETEGVEPNVDPLASAEVEHEIAVVSVDSPEEEMASVLFTTTAMDNGIMTLEPTHTTFREQDFPSNSDISSRSVTGSVHALTDSSNHSSYLGVGSISTTAISSTPLGGPAAARWGSPESLDPVLRPHVSLPVGRVQVNVSVVSEVGLPGGPSPGVSFSGVAMHPDRIHVASAYVTEKMASKPVKKNRARLPRVGPCTSPRTFTRSGMVRGEAGGLSGRQVLIGPRNESAGPGLGSESEVEGDMEDILG